MAPTNMPPSRPICCRSNASIGHAAGMDTTHEQFLKIQIDPAFYRSGEHSDIIVRYGSGSDTRERMLHKVVLCSQSEFFRLMLAAPMKVSLVFFSNECGKQNSSQPLHNPGIP